MNFITGLGLTFVDSFFTYGTACVSVEAVDFHGSLLWCAWLYTSVCSKVAMCTELQLCYT